MLCNFYLSVAAGNFVCADPSWDTQACCTLSNQPANQPNNQPTNKHARNERKNERKKERKKQRNKETKKQTKKQTNNQTNREREKRRIKPCCTWSSHTIDLKPGTLLVSLLGGWRCRISARAGWHGVSVL